MWTVMEANRDQSTVGRVALGAADLDLRLLLLVSGDFSDLHVPTDPVAT